jgi:hypothetical protein
VPENTPSQHQLFTNASFKLQVGLQHNSSSAAGEAARHV